METKQQHSSDVKKDVIKVIRNIRFTNREIDVIACLLGGRSYKKIASVFAISPKTVEHHVYNIMSKVGCSSREGIIDFIEKSDKFTLVKAHYASILVKTAFEQELKKASVISKENNTSCLIFYYNTQITKTSFVYQLEQCLNTAGVKTFNKGWAKDKSQGFIANKIGSKQANCIIYVLSHAFVEQLKLLKYDIHQEANNLIPLLKEGSAPIIFLLIDDKTILDTNKNPADFTYISLLESKSYYFLFFNLLKKILPRQNIDVHIAQFKRQYEALDGTIAQEWPRVAGLNEIQNSNQKKKNIFKWLILFLILLLGVGFAFFKINNKANVFPGYQLQNTESEVADNKQNILLDNKQKTAVFNLPPHNSGFTGREDSLSKIKKQLAKQKVGVISQAIAGLGGVGKTQLATEFAYRAVEKDEYSTIFWLPSETPSAMNHAYTEFAKFLQVDVRGFDADKVQEFVHRELAKKYKGAEVLFILDNVPAYDDIREYMRELHKQLSPFLTVHILITSRSQHWPEHPLTLDVFTPEEALSFVKKHLPNEREDSMVRLAKDLHYFPLALNQATAYINRHTNIDDYLKLYAGRQKDFLNKFSEDKNQYNETLWKTWQIALDKLSDKARGILSVSSYLCPDDIPIEFFDDLSIEERGDAIEELRKHSFIILVNNNKSFKIHRLLQEVIRNTIAYDNKNTIFGKYRELVKASKLLKNKFDFSYAEYDTWSLCRQYLDHAQSLAEHAVNTRNESFYIMGMQLYAQIAMYLTYAQQNLVDAKKLFEKILILVRQRYKSDRSFKVVLANINTHLGYIEQLMGDTNQAENYFKKSMAVYDSKIPGVSSDMDKLLTNLRWHQDLILSDGVKCDHAFTLYNWAFVKQDLSYYNEAMWGYEKALEILDKCNDVDSALIYNALFLIKLSTLFRFSEGNMEESESALNLAVTILDKNFPDHLDLMAYKDEFVADQQYYLGMYNEAKETIENCLKNRLLIYSKDHVKVGVALFVLGYVLCASNRIVESIEAFKQSEVIYNSNFKEGHLYFAYFYIHISYVYEKHKEYDKALWYLAKAQEIFIKHWGEKTPIVLAHDFPPIEKLPILRGGGKNIDYYIQALNIVKTLFGAQHIRTARYRYLLGQVFENIRDKNKAKKHYQEALSIAKRQHFDNKLPALVIHEENIRIIQRRLEELS